MAITILSIVGGPHRLGLIGKLSFHSALQLGRELRLCILQMCFQPRAHPLCAVGNRLLFSVIALREKHRNLRHKCQAESRKSIRQPFFPNTLTNRRKSGKSTLPFPSISYWASDDPNALTNRRKISKLDYAIAVKIRFDFHRKRLNNARNRQHKLRAIRIITQNTDITRKLALHGLGKRNRNRPPNYPEIV